MLLSMLENTTHPFVIRRRLPSPFSDARIYVSTEGGLRYLRPNPYQIDPFLFQMADEFVQPGNVVWDIGANLGLFSFAAAVAAGPSGLVLAVEPDPSLVTLLHRSADANRRHAPVEVVPVAVADKLGFSRFNIAKYSRAPNHLDGCGYGQLGQYGVRAAHTVPTVTLDWLSEQFPAPDVVKISVVSAEAKVLSCASAILRNHATIIFSELWEENATAVGDVFNAHGYTLYDGSQSRDRRVPVEFPPWKTVAIPAYPAKSAPNVSNT